MILSIRPLGFVWETADPFLFCVHHDDAYPAGNGKMGPAASLSGRDMGQDFEGKDGWRMYHGREVPGFPAHPHRGFETVTLVRKGLIDHSDSLGAAARFGGGDVQWLTAGEGIVHSEMFPLLREDDKNPLELFQIWLNLPAADKMVPPHFSMLWAEQIPRRVLTDGNGKETILTIVAGAFEGATPPPPPPHSWASKAKSELLIWTLKMQPGATFKIPAASPGLNRRLYLFRGGPVTIAGKPVGPRSGVGLSSDVAIEVENGTGGGEAEFLLLQGRPIAEPVAQHGPFVMNSTAEIQKAFSDYQRTRFGGWPWPKSDPVHGADPGRFARRPDGKVERPG